CFLKKGEADDQKAYAELKARLQQPLTTARRVLNDEMWARVQHPDEDKFLATLFALVGPTLMQPLAQPHKALNLVRKEALDATDPRSLAKTLRYVVTTFAATAPEVYLRPDQKEPFGFLNAVDKQTLVPVFTLGQPLLAEKKPERELVFELS